MEVRTLETECCINKSIIRVIPWAVIKTYSASRQLWPPGLGTHSRGGCSAYETLQHFSSLWWALNDRGQAGVKAAAVRAKGFFRWANLSGSEGPDTESAPNSITSPASRESISIIELGGGRAPPAPQPSQKGENRANAPSQGPGSPSFRSQSVLSI